MAEGPSHRLSGPGKAGENQEGETLGAPSLEEARESLSYWQKRLYELPVYERAKRRESREMVARWEERVEAAERERFGPSPLQQLLAALGLRRMRTQTIFAGLKVAVALLIALVVLIIVLVIVFWPDIEPIAREMFRQNGQG